MKSTKFKLIPTFFIFIFLLLCGMQGYAASSKTLKEDSYNKIKKSGKVPPLKPKNKKSTFQEDWTQVPLQKIETPSWIDNLKSFQPVQPTCVIDGNSIITTIAGNGTRGFSGDNGQATNAQLNFPRSIAVDRVGNVYIYDQENNRIRKVGQNGIITTIAGNGTRGFLGENVQATGAQLGLIWGVAVDGVGHVYIAGYNRIRKVNQNGIITTIVGNEWTRGFSGDNGRATDAEIYNPTGIAVDGVGNIYFGDRYNFRIRQIDQNGIITTIAGNGTQGFSGDNGPATNAQLGFISDVAIDRVENVYFSGSCRLRKIENGIITTIAGNGRCGFTAINVGNGRLVFLGDNGPATETGVAPSGVAVDGMGNVYIPDFNRIRKIDQNGIITTIAGDNTRGFSGDNGRAINAKLSESWGIAVDRVGNVYFSDSGNDRIRKIACRLPCEDILRERVNAAPYLLGCLECVENNAQPTPKSDRTGCGYGCECRQGECRGINFPDRCNQVY